MHNLTIRVPRYRILSVLVPLSAHQDFTCDILATFLLQVYFKATECTHEVENILIAYQVGCCDRDAPVL